ncbi:MAG TPA: aspartate kinase [Nitrososphaerales archaeon]|nr:aspartate kinase [Nitrososphaerales archaeon]
MKLVMKFGGSLVGSPGGVKRIADIVTDYAPRNSVVVVVSALNNVTDVLLDAGENASNWYPNEIANTVEQLRKVHLRAVAETSLGLKEKDSLAKELGGMLTNLQTTLTGVSILGELSPRSRDMIVSYGERLAAPIVAAELQSRGVVSWSATGGASGIVTDNSFGEAAPDMVATRKELKKELLRPMTRGEVPVVTGFIARSKEGETTTLGRGGSDYTATIIGDAIGADEVWIWTDVDGIMTGDPRIVKRPAVVSQLSYAEAEELAFFGAKNMHPLALGPARLAGIPVRIKNGFRPSEKGTLITEGARRSDGVVKCVAVVKQVGLLTVSGESLQGKPGIAAKVFAALGSAKVNVLMISQSVSEASISMVVRRNALAAAESAVSSKLSEEKMAVSVDADQRVAVVAAVGAGMRGTRGVAAKVFGAVAARGINVRMIAQGSSELNISFVVDEQDADAAARALHELVVVKGGRS